MEKSPKPLVPAFGRRVLRTLLCLGAFACATFAVVSDRALREQELHSSIKLARLVTAALQPGPGGDLSRVATAILDRSEHVIAIAPLTAAGGCEAVYPNRPAHRQAVAAALTAFEDAGFGPGTEAPAASFTVNGPRDGKPADVTSVIVPLNGTSSPHPRQAIVLLRQDPVVPLVIGAMQTIAAPMSAILLLGYWSLKRWFDRRVACPLRRMGSLASDPASVARAIPTLDSGSWRETAGIARKFDQLLKSIYESEARSRRFERETLRQMRDREKGFDRELRRAKDRATRDPLTRLRNRIYLSEKLEPLFLEHSTAGADLSAIMIDLDNFKAHNDTHGHHAGDALLSFVGALLRGTIRPEDHAIRYGGDEFLLLLPETNAKQAETVAERLVRLFGQYTGRLGPKANLTISAGVASVKADGCRSGDELVARADAAMYVAKRGGRNAVATCPTVQGSWDACGSKPVRKLTRPRTEKAR